MGSYVASSHGRRQLPIEDSAYRPPRPLRVGPRISPRVATVLVFVTLVSIVVLGGWLRFRELETKSLYGDEIITIQRLERHTIGRIFAGDVSHRTFHYTVTHYVVDWLGLSEFSLRLVPALLGTLGVLALYFAGSLFFDRRVALASSLLFAISTYHVNESQYGRFYPGLALFSLLSIVFLVRAVYLGRWYYWVGFVVAVMLNIYNHLFGFFVLAACGIWGLIAVGAALYRTTSTKRPQIFLRALLLQRLLPLAVGGMLILVLYVPAIIEMQRTETFDDLGVGEGSINPWTADGFLSLNFALNLFTVFGPGGGWIRALYIGLFVLGLLGLAVRRQWQPLLLISLVFGLPSIILSVTQPGHFFSPKYVIFMVPLYVLGVAGGVFFVGEVVASAFIRLVRLGHGTRVAVAQLVGLTLLTSIAIQNVPALLRYYHETRSYDPRGVATFLYQHAQPEDVTLMLARTRGLGYRYYNSELQGTDLFAGEDRVRTIATVQAAERLSARAQRVWIIADARGRGDADPDLYRWMVQESFVIPFNSYSLYLKLPNGDVLSPEERIDLLTDAWRASRGTHNAQIPIQLGDAYSALGDWPQAIEAYRAAVRARPSLPHAWSKLARAQAEQGRWSEAVATYREAVERVPKEPVAMYREAAGRLPETTKFHLSLGELYEEMGHPNLAREIYQQAATAAGDPSVEFIALGDAALKSGNGSKAVDLFQMAVQQDSTNQVAWAGLAHAYWLVRSPDMIETAYQRALTVPQPEWEGLYRLAQLDLQRGRYDEAEALARQGLELAETLPENTAIRFLQNRRGIRLQSSVIKGKLLIGDIAQARGDWYAAQAAYEDVRQWSPYNTEPLLRLGALAARQQAFETALAWYRRADVIAPGSADVQARLGRTYSQLGSMGDAVVSYRTAVRLEPGAWRHRLALADLLRSLGQDEAAEAEYRAIVKAAERSPVRPEFGNHRVSPQIAADFGIYARAYAGLGDLVLTQAMREHRSLHQAEQLYRRGLTYAPEEPLLHAGLTDLYVAGHRVQDALAQYRKYLELVPPSASLQVKLGDLFYLNGALEDSQEAYQAALELDPSHQPAYLHLGRLFLVQGRTVEAERVFQEAVVAAPENPLGYVRLGDIYEAQNDLNMALSYYQEALAQDPTHPTAYVEIGDLHFAAGEVEAAMAWYERAYALNPESERIQRRMQTFRE